jgi:ketosteroid isomerase-like protein
MTMSDLKRQPRWLVLLGCIALLAGCQPAERTEAAASAAPAFDDQAISAVVEQFHAALAAGDSARAISLLHPEVVIYEAGHAETLAQYRAGHLAADIAFAQAVPSETTAEQVIDLGGTALVLRESVSRGIFRDREIDSHGTETMVLVPLEDRWVIRHIHWSSAR